MTEFRFFPSNPALTALGGSSGTQFIVALGFEARAAQWLDGYWWLVPATGVTATQTFCTWCLTGAAAGTVIPASVVTSAATPLIAGQWNFIPLPSPIPLAPNTAYLAQTGYVIGTTFTNQGAYWSGGGTAPAGISVLNSLSQVAILAYGDGTSGGTNANPWGTAQQTFLVGSGTDPTAHLATSAGGSDNFGLDIQMRDTVPANYTGEFELYPNNLSGNPSVVLDLNVNYNVGTTVTLARPCPLNAIKYLVPAGASGFATRASVFSVTAGGLGGAELYAITAPSWSNTGGLWYRANFPVPPILPPGTYRFTVYNANGTLPGGWNAKDSVTSAFGASGPLSAGITMGPMFAPPVATAPLCWDYNGSLPGATPPFSAGTSEPGQCVFGQDPGGALAVPWLYAGPASGSNPQNYFVSPVLGQPVSAGGLVTPDSETVSRINKRRLLW